MRTIGDLEHFVLAEGETLILRLTRNFSEEQLAQMRHAIKAALPGRPVLVLPPEVEVCAGKIEVFGVDPGRDERSTPTQEDIDAQRKAIKDAYCVGRTVYARSDEGWFYVHHTANPHVFDWSKFDYSLTKPKGLR
jgi:hypothetical protein